MPRYVPGFLGIVVVPWWLSSSDRSLPLTDGVRNMAHAQDGTGSVERDRDQIDPPDGIANVWVLRQVGSARPQQAPRLSRGDALLGPPHGFAVAGLDLDEDQFGLVPKDEIQLTAAASPVCLDEDETTGFEVPARVALAGRAECSPRRRGHGAVSGDVGRIKVNDRRWTGPGPWRRSAARWTGVPYPLWMPNP